MNMVFVYHNVHKVRAGIETITYTTRGERSKTEPPRVLEVHMLDNLCYTDIFLFGIEFLAFKPLRLRPG